MGTGQGGDPRGGNAWLEGGPSRGRMLIRGHLRWARLLSSHGRETKQKGTKMLPKAGGPHVTNGPQSLPCQSQESHHRAQLGVQEKPPPSAGERGARPGGLSQVCVCGEPGGLGQVCVLGGPGGLGQVCVLGGALGPRSGVRGEAGPSSQRCSPCCRWPGSPGSTPPQAPLHSLTASLR